MEARQFFVDDGSPVPVYAQICEQVLSAVARGDLRRGEQLPSIREVAVALALTPNTVNRAYAELERDGVIEVRRGRGTFVAPGPTRGAAQAAPRLADIAERFVDRARALGYEDPHIARAVDDKLKRRLPMRRRS